MRFEAGWWVEAGGERAQVLLDRGGAQVYLRFDTRLAWVLREEIAVPRWSNAVFPHLSFRGVLIASAQCRLAGAGGMKVMQAEDKS